jgi:hypothetical protein
MVPNPSCLDDFNMYTPLKKPCIGDRVRLAGFLGEFEIVRVVHNGSMVDLKHLDLHGSDYIEQEVSAYDLTYVTGSHASSVAQRTAPPSTNSAAGPAGRRAPGRVSPAPNSRA